jgi:hypothetical protein
MQTQKRKKKLKNKKESLNIHPIKHEKFGNLNNYSEDIIKEIIDKVISLSITEVIKTKIDSKISNFCFETIKHYLNLTVSLTNINHDRDNLYDIENICEENNRPNSDEKRYKMKNHKKCKKIRNKKAENDLFDLTDINRDFEAEMILKDKDIYDYLNKSIDFEGIIDKKRLSKSNYWGNIPQPKTYGPLRIASKSNALVKNIIINKYDKILSNDIKPEKITPKKKTSILLKSRRQSKSPMIDELTLRKTEAKKLLEIRQRKYLLLDMEEMKDIEEKKTRKEESDEIKELRKLKLEQIQLLKEEEDKTKYAQNFISQNVSNFEYDLDSLNLTAFERARNVQIQRKLVEDQIRKGNFTYDFNNKMILVRKLKPESLLDDFPMAISKPKDKLNLSKINTTKKKSDDLSKEDILNEQFKKKDIVEEKNYVSNYFNYNFNFNLKIAPSGSNFEKIRPAVGVNIYEGDEIKTGGREFFEKFKKFSIKDYDKMLKEIKEQQKAMNKSLQEKSKKEENKNLDGLISNKKGMNSSVDISKINKNFGYLNKRMKNIKFNAFKNKMNKSQSQVFTIDKNNLYNNLLVRDETNEINYNKKNDGDFSERLNQNNLFIRRLKNIIKLKKTESPSFQLIDSFNKSIIIRGANNDLRKRKDKEFEIVKEKEKKDNKLPIIPLKSNRSVIFTRKEQFFRTRMKKIFED